MGAFPARSRGYCWGDHAVLFLFDAAGAGWDVEVGVAFRTSMTFLISSPLLDPIIVAGVVLLFDWRIALVYTVVTAAWSLLAPSMGTTRHGQPAQASQGRRRRQHPHPGQACATRSGPHSARPGPI